jgi:ubiquinone/menaquinone biosynthesis C-methylase UbiE
VELSAPEPEWSVLDVATGTGHTAFALAPYVASVIGMDLTPEMLLEAEKLRKDRACGNVTFHIADVHHLPFRENTFHLITCRRAAHHFSDIFRAIREMRRVLRVDGRLLIDDRSVPEDDFVDTRMNALDRFHDASHVRQYRPGEWREMLETSGFRIEAVEPYVKHRPLTALTQGVSQENVRKIHEVLDGLDEGEKRALNLKTIEGQPYLNHWYVMIVARKVAGCRRKTPSKGM